MGPTVLSDALKDLARDADPNLLVGFDTSDDAAVYRLSDELALITTVDFVTPPVDDPYWFGQIAASNSLSDVYAMGGRPLTALNLVMFPEGTLPIGHLKEILRGGHDKVAEAGAAMAGGHTVDDQEPKYGLSVTGIVHPDRILRNAGARPNDLLVLTKPIGIGVLFNACRSGKLPLTELEPLLQTVAALNGPALEAALKFDVHACTDITGFGLAGHILEMALASSVSVDLFFDRIPLFPYAVEMYKKGETTRSNKPNRALLEGRLDLTVSLPREQEELLIDPQTSGGLLFSLPREQADEVVSTIRAAGVSDATVIGEVAEGEPRIRVR